MAETRDNGYVYDRLLKKKKCTIGSGAEAGKFSRICVSKVTLQTVKIHQNAFAATDPAEGAIIVAVVREKEQMSVPR